MTMTADTISRDKNPGVASSNTRMIRAIRIPDSSMLVPFFVPHNVSNLFLQELFTIEFRDPLFCF